MVCGLAAVVGGTAVGLAASVVGAAVGAAVVCGLSSVLGRLSAVGLASVVGRLSAVAPARQAASSKRMSKSSGRFVIGQLSLRGRRRANWGIGESARLSARRFLEC